MRLAILAILVMSSASLLLRADLAAGESPGEQLADASEEVKVASRPMAHPIAILPLKERGREVDGVGQKLSDLLFASMVSDPNLLLVEREEFDQVINEAELNLSAMVDPNQAIAVGRLTGAKLLVTGSVFQTDEELFAIAKIISTETTRVVGASVSVPVDESMDKLARQLASKVIGLIDQNANTLIAPEPEPNVFVKEFQQKHKDQPLPSVAFRITERHLNAPTIDPAVETELSILMSQCGFKVFGDTQDNALKPDLIISGEAISEFASRRKGLVSVKARVELKAVTSATGEVVVVDRQTDMALGLAEQITAKDALQNCAAKIARRMLPKLAAQTNR